MAGVITYIDVFKTFFLHKKTILDQIKPFGGKRPLKMVKTLAFMIFCVNGKMHLCKR